VKEVLLTVHFDLQRSEDDEAAFVAAVMRRHGRGLASGLILVLADLDAE
jgi:hypothetical protein